MKKTSTMKKLLILFFIILFSFFNLFASIPNLHVNYLNSINTPTINSIANGITYSNLYKTTEANRRATKDEATLLSALKEYKTPEEQYRLIAAACALTHCSDHIPKNDPNYQSLALLQQEGTNYQDEQSLLTSYGAKAVYADYGVNLKEVLFDYGVTDSLSDASDRYQIATRGLGAVQSLGGAAMVFGGVAVAPSCETGVGCLAVAYLATNGMDNAIAGYNTLIYGEYNPTFGAKTLETLGVSNEYAELIYNATALGAGGTSIITSVVAKTSNSVGKGSVVVKEGGGGDAVVRFGHNNNQIYHAFRHIDDMGLDRNVVQKTIEADIKKVLESKEILKPKILEVNGQKIEYHPYKLPDGTINVGRINAIKN
jgi:hypothetical protein